MSPPIPSARHGLALLLILSTASPAWAQAVLYNFTGFPNDGSGPVGSLVALGSAFYGMTNTGGNFGDGTIFKINRDGTGFTLLRSFGSSILTDGLDPFGSLAQSGGVFYGMTEGGGSSINGDTVFKINPDGTGFTILHPFQGGAADGVGPLGSPVVSGGVIYGMTSQGGTANVGVVYRVNPDGTEFQVIHSFTGGAFDGSSPSFSALVVSGGAIYGMTPVGGAAGLGAVFRMNTDGTGFTVLHSFVATTGDGYNPAGGLTLIGNTLYGMTHVGGSQGIGAIFRINTDGTGYSLVRSFVGSPTDGAEPVGTLFYDGTRLFGTTPRGGAYGVGSNNALGVVFGINPDGSDYEVLNSFGADPANGLGPTDVIEFNGSLHGMTGSGGSANDGVIYTIPAPEPSSLALLAAAGAAAAIARRGLRRGK
jgi:uncharacterized repeat protein (TIGR03803 family)